MDQNTAVNDVTTNKIAYKTNWCLKNINKPWNWMTPSVEINKFMDAQKSTNTVNKTNSDINT